MDWKTWALFVAMETPLCLTPGPAVLFVLSHGLARGGRESVWANLGILSGNVIYFAISATGLGALLLRSYDLFFLIKWLGAAYLIWLGVSAWIGKSKPLQIRAEARPRSGPRTLANGVLLQLANPKALVFFTAFLPLFIDPARPLVPQFVILAATSTVLEFFILLGFGMLAGRAARLAERPSMAKVMDRVAGSMLLGAGLMVAALKKA